MEGLETLGLTSGEPIPLELEPLIQDLETLGLTSQEYPHPVLELIMEDLEDILFAMVEWGGTLGRYSGSIHTPIHHTNFRSDYPKSHRPPLPELVLFMEGLETLDLTSQEPPPPPELELLIQDLETLDLTSQECSHPELELLIEYLESSDLTSQNPPLHPPL